MRAADTGELRAAAKGLQFLKAFYLTRFFLKFAA
jgi:hypothetical protein